MFKKRKANKSIDTKRINKEIHNIQASIDRNLACNEEKKYSDQLSAPGDKQAPENHHQNIERILTDRVDSGVEKPQNDFNRKVNIELTSNIPKASSPEAKPKLHIEEPKSKTSNIKNGEIFASHTFDYQMNICKDFQKTGFCRYGDECKFVHERDSYDTTNKFMPNYKATSTKILNRSKNSSNKEIAQEDALKCVLCTNNPSSPMRIKCGHLCCEACFLKGCSQNAECSLCHLSIGTKAEAVD